MTFLRLTVCHICVTDHIHFWRGRPLQYKVEQIIHLLHSLVMSCGEDVVPPSPRLPRSHYLSCARQVTAILFPVFNFIYVLPFLIDL